MVAEVRAPLAPAWRLIAVRGLRSLSQGYLNVAVPLYLASLGMSAQGLGILFTASFLLGAALLVPVGALADRYRRLPFLVIFTGLMVLWGLIYTTTSYLPLLWVISAVAGIGRGGGGQGGGQAGPFAPAEQALLADLVPASDRPRIFTWNAFVGAIMAAAGSMLSALPRWMPGLRVGPVAGDRVLFLATAVIGVVSLLLLVGVPERPAPRLRAPQGLRLVSPRSARWVAQQALAGATNAVGMGFTSALFVIWLNYRFHVGAAVIGPVFSASFVVQAGAFFLATAVARRFGSVRTIVWSRVLSAGLVVAIALAPTLVAAAVLQVARTAAAMMATPVRQSFTMGLFPARERASAAALTGLARRVPASLSPALAGALMDAGNLELPFFLGGLCQFVSAGLYWYFFQRLDQRGLQDEGGGQVSWAGVDDTSD